MSLFSIPSTAGSQLQDTFPPPPLSVPFRIFKDARKDKGQDDFLGNVVVRLKVSVAVHPLLQGAPRAPVQPPGIRAGSQPCDSTQHTLDPVSEPQTDVRSLTVPQSFQHSVTVYPVFLIRSSCPMNAVG